MKRRSVILAGATFAVTAVMTLGATTFAHAADKGVWVMAVGNPDRVSSAGSFVHIDDGDSFRVGDHFADGHGVRGSLLNSSGNVIKSSYNGKGAGKYTSFSYDIKGGKKYYLKVCLVDGASDTTPLKCMQEVLYE